MINLLPGKSNVIFRVDQGLVLSDLLCYASDPLGLLQVWEFVSFDVLFFVAASTGLLLSAALYKESLKEAALRLYAQIKVNYSELLSYLTKNVIISYFILLVASLYVDQIRYYLNLSLLYYVAIALLILSLSLTNSRRSVTRTKLAAFIGVILVFLNVPLGIVGQTYTFKLTLLVVVLMATIVVKREGEPVTTISTTYPIVSIAIGLLIFISSILYLYRLDTFHLFSDEYYAFDTAAGFYHTGKLYRWDWIASELGDRYYPRGWPHTLLVAASFALFGISEWSARLVSVIFGILTIPTAYFVIHYFTDRRNIALATCVSLILYPNFISYFRWTRMYALLIPVFMILTYLVFRVLIEENTVDFRIDRVNNAIDRHLDFNVLLGVLSLPVLYIAYEIHYNALIILATSYVFVLYKAATDGAKYRITAVVGLTSTACLGFISIYTAYLDVFHNLLSFFGRRNHEYITYLFQFPFEIGFGGLLFATGLVMISKIEDAILRDKLVFLYILCIFSIVFYVFIGDRYVAFAYVIHIIPFAIALVLVAYFKFVEAMGVTASKGILVVLFVVSMLHAGFAGTLGYDNPYGSTYHDMYFDDPVNYTESYGTIEQNFDPERDVVFAFALRDYYLRDLPEDTVVIDMKEYNQGNSGKFYEDIRRQESGWITWPTEKAYHIDPEIRAYVNDNFEQYHGHDVDRTSVEVFYFNESMVNGNKVDQRVESRSIYAKGYIRQNTLVITFGLYDE